MQEPLYGFGEADNENQNALVVSIGEADNENQNALVVSIGEAGVANDSRKALLAIVK